MQQLQLDEISSDELDKAILMGAITATGMGIVFLQWLCKKCHWNRSIISNEQSAQRDIWLEFRRHITPEKLALIEYQELKDDQERLKAILEVAPAKEEDSVL